MRGRWVQLVLEQLDLPLPLCSRSNMLIPVCHLLVVLRQMLPYSLPWAAFRFLMMVLPRPPGSLCNTTRIGICWWKGKLSYPRLFQYTPTLPLPVPPAIAGYTGWLLALRLLLERGTFQRISLKLSQKRSFPVLLWQQRAHWQIYPQIFCWGLRFQSVFFRTLCSNHGSLGEVREKEDSLKCHQSHQRGFPQWISSLV